MKILVISDNHGDQAILKTVFDGFRDQVDAIFHCGDSETDQTNPVFNNVAVVEGNNDPRGAFPDDVVQAVGNETVFMTHGDLYGVSMGLTHLSLKAQEVGATLAFFGHTHQLGAESEEGSVYVNPGSISLPRGEYASIGGTFAIVTSTPTAVQVDFYDRHLDRLPELQTNFER